MSKEDKDQKSLENAVDSYDEMPEDPYQMEDCFYQGELQKLKTDQAYQKFFIDKNLNFDFLFKLANNKKHPIEDGDILYATDQDLRQFNTFQDKKKDKILEEISNINFAIDFGTIDFQQKFFAKYILIMSSKLNTEQEKAEYLKIKICTTKFKKILFITQNEMGEYLSKFRTIYSQFNKIQSYLSDYAIQTFNKFFDFEFFIILEEKMKEVLIINQIDTSFQIAWAYISSTTKGIDNLKLDFIDTDYTQEEYISYIKELFRNNIYQCFRDIIDCQDMTQQQIMALVMEQNKDIFEFYLKSQFTKIKEKKSIQYHQVIYIQLIILI